MKTAYIYPCSGKSSVVTNPYIDDFISSLSNFIFFANTARPSNKGIMDIYSYLGKVDIVFFNWIEELPDKRGGILQVILFVVSVFLIKRRKIKIFYTLHNKESHYNTHKLLKRFLRSFMLKNTDYILCHSSEGMEILHRKYSKTGKTIYLPHPSLTKPLPPVVQEKKYDILIWGAIRPYKGIDEYLKFLESKNILDKYRTLIIGQIFPEEYEHELNKYKSDSIHIVNEYIDDEVLNKLIGQSKIILFNYKENSVLSSGALIYSLSQGANIMGRNIGAFKDIYQEGLIEVFDDYEELIEKINAQLNSTINKREKISNYLESNSWEKFGVKIAKWISE